MTVNAGRKTVPRPRWPWHADDLASRRRFLGLGATAAVLGPSLLVACGSGGETSASRRGRAAQPDDGDVASGNVRVSDWPLYMVAGFVAAFEAKTGLVVDYREDFNDNEQWFAKNKEPLSRRQDIGADIVVPTQFMALRLRQLGFLNEIGDSRVPNRKNLRRDLLDNPTDPGCKFTAPYLSGMVGLAYNRAATGRDITTVDDLWDPKFKGKVSLLSDVYDGLGMVMQAQGNSVESPTFKGVRDAVDTIREEKDKGQIRRFTGNDYVDDLAAGNIVVAQAYSGDVVQLQADNPDLKFVVPEAGGNWFVDTQVIPCTTQNQHGAEAWIDFVYDRANYAKLIAFTQYVPVLSDMTDELNEVDPKLAANPLINPPQTYLDKLTTWASLTDEQSKQYTDLYTAVTGG